MTTATATADDPQQAERQPEPVKFGCGPLRDWFLNQIAVRPEPDDD